MGAVADQIIAVGERQLGLPLPYLRTIADSSSAAFAKWMMAMPAANHRKAAPPNEWHLARLVATQAQDCGTCVQVVVNAARRDGVPPDTLRAALEGREADLTETERLAVGFGRAVSSQAPDVLEWVRRVEQTFGPDAHVELAMAVGLCQMFPVVKRGLGQAVACSLVTVEV